MTTYKPYKDEITGASLSGSDGASNRTYTVTNTPLFLVNNIIVQNVAINTTTDYTVSGNTITFLNPIDDVFVIEVTYFVQITDTGSPISGDLKYTTYLDFSRFLQADKHVPNREQSTFPAKEEIGTGDDSATRFTLDNGNVIQDTLTIYYGASETAATSTLTETTHYTVDYDNGIITLTSAGVTLLSTNIMYGVYDYNGMDKKNSVIQDNLIKAEADVDRMTNSAFFDSTASTPNFIEIINELQEGQGTYNVVYAADKYPLNSTTTTLNGAVSADDSTITVVSTDGFPDSGSFAVETDKIAYTGKTSTTFTGCTSVLAHDDGKTVTSFIFEVSLTSEGTAPSWEVLEYDSGYSVDFECGEFKSNSNLTDTIYDNYQPQLRTWDRVRMTYQYGYGTIYSDVIHLVHLVAARYMFHGQILNALARNSNGF